MKRARVIGLRDNALGAMVGAAIGAAFFVAVYGVRILDPRLIDWLLHGDPAWHYLGAAFHRVAPWGWPLGLVPGFGAPVGTTLVFADAIPLLALAVKPFDAWLPVDFQLFGIWMLLCHLLQGLFAQRVLHRLGVRGPALWSGVFLIVASPALALRAYGHMALMAHWLMLAAFDTCLARRSRRHAPLLLLAVLVHAYWLPMLAPFACIGWWRDRPGWRHLAAWGALVLASMAAVGYFAASPGQLVADGYRVYSANLLTLLDPMDWRAFLAAHGRAAEHASQWSRLLPAWGQVGQGQYEGFAYLGAGALALIALALMVSIPGVRGASRAASRTPRRAPARPASPERAMTERGAAALAPLLAVALLMFVFALSSRITLGATVLIDLPLPDTVQRAFGVFRATGRFVWPLALLLVLWACARVAHAWPGRAAALLMLACASLQAWDLCAKWGEFGRRFAAGGVGGLPEYAEPGWAAMRGRDHLVVLPARIDADWIRPALFAARHRMSINLARVARGDPGALQTAQEQAIAQLRAGAPRADTAYWVRDAALAAALPAALERTVVRHRLGDGVLLVPRAPAAGALR